MSKAAKMRKRRRSAIDIDIESAAEFEPQGACCEGRRVVVVRAQANRANDVMIGLSLR